jgi:S-formylglutathione hydrolase FrmB
MGGYGAMKLGLSFQERFAAAASLSGAVDVNRLAKERFTPDLLNVVSDPSTIPGSSGDLFALAERLAGQPSIPLLFQCCGTEDFLYEDNIRFRDHCLQLGLPLTYEEEPGNHEWGYWDRKIERVLNWLPIRQG